MFRNKAFFIYLILIAMSLPIIKSMQLGKTENSSYFNITINDNGNSAEIIEKYITIPFEKKIRHLYFIKNIQTISKNQQMQAFVELHKSQDTSYNRILLRNKILEAYELMPRSCTRPQILEGKNNSPALLFSITDSDTEFCRDVVKPLLEALKESTLVEMYGEEKKNLSLRNKLNSASNNLLAHKNIANILDNNTNPCFAGVERKQGVLLPIIFSNNRLELEDLKMFMLFDKAKNSTLLGDQLKIEIKQSKQESFSKRENSASISFAIYANPSDYAELSDKVKILLNKFPQLDVKIIKDLGEEETQRFRLYLLLLIILAIIGGIFLALIFKNYKILLRSLFFVFSSLYFTAIVQIALNLKISEDFFFLLFLNMLYNFYLIFCTIRSSRRFDYYRQLLLNALIIGISSIILSQILADYVGNITTILSNFLICSLFLHFFPQKEEELNFYLPNKLKILKSLPLKIDRYGISTLLVVIIAVIMLDNSAIVLERLESERQLTFSANFKSGTTVEFAEEVCEKIYNFIKVEDEKSQVICNYRSEKANFTVENISKRKKILLAARLKELGSQITDCSIYIPQDSSTNGSQLRVKIFSKDYNFITESINKLNLELQKSNLEVQLWNNFKMPAQGITININDTLPSINSNKLSLAAELSNYLKNPIIAILIVGSKELETRLIHLEEESSLSQLKKLKIPIDDQEVGIESFATISKKIEDFTIFRENTRPYLEITTVSQTLNLAQLRRITENSLELPPERATFEIQEKSDIDGVNILKWLLTQILAITIIYFIFYEKITASVGVLNRVTLGVGIATILFCSNFTLSSYEIITLFYLSTFLSNSKKAPGL
ncbi:MAG: efflux RND transporter permease subunit [Spirochaetales bacterium]|nr:efflux RND transporter permease subunit [Spirochaetales bacterium]